jgi:hypothetical protein
MIAEKDQSGFFIGINIMFIQPPGIKSKHTGEEDTFHFFFVYRV